MHTLTESAISNPFPFEGVGYVQENCLCDTALGKFEGFR